MTPDGFLIPHEELILVTGANGFIGSRVVQRLLERGFTNLRCFVRPSSDLSRLQGVLEPFEKARAEILVGNLLSREDCKQAVAGASIVIHLAAGIESSYSGAFMNSVVTTRNLLDAVVEHGGIRRFLNVSSMGVYSNRKMRRGALLDESCAIEDRPDLKGEAYCYGKIKQDELLLEYGKKHDIPYVIVRPGVVYGPGKRAISGRIGIDTFGVFLHLGGSNRIPLTFVENCADAIVLAALVRGVDGEVFNIVDDDLPTSRQFLRMYKKKVRRFRSIYLPFTATRLLCYFWEKYSRWSRGQVPAAFNPRRCAADWRGNSYSNQKLKTLTGWSPTVPFEEAASRFFAYLKEASASR